METYIVLRNANRNLPIAERNDGGFPSAEWQTESRTVETVPAPEIDIATLDDRQVNEIRNQPETTIAPAMQTTLIQPVALGPAIDTQLIAPVASGAAQALPAWGLGAVRCGRGYDGKGVSMAVLDTGIDDKHPAFTGVTFDNKDFTNTGIMDRKGHGTHCAGTIFGRPVDGVAIGVAPGVERADVGKVLDDNGHGSSDMAFAGLRWAIDKKADVISMSLGFDFPGTVAKKVAEGWPVELATSNALVAFAANLTMFNAIMDMLNARALFDEGSVVVAAAGNESRRDIYKISASLPASAAGVISVAAVSQEPGDTYKVASFSNILATVCAPGVAIKSAKIGGGLAEANGTSMACPHVAGITALWWQAMRQGNGGRSSAREVGAQVLAKVRKNVFVGGLNTVDHGAGLVTGPAIDAHS